MQHKLKIHDIHEDALLPCSEGLESTLLKIAHCRANCHDTNLILLSKYTCIKYTLPLVETFCPTVIPNGNVFLNQFLHSQHGIKFIWVKWQFKKFSLINESIHLQENEGVSSLISA